MLLVVNYAAIVVKATKRTRPLERKVGFTPQVQLDGIVSLGCFGEVASNPRGIDR